MTTRKKATAKASKVPHSPDAEVGPITTKAAMESHVRALNLRCRGPRDEKQLLVWRELMGEGAIEKARVVQTRIGCGYDFGLTVLSEPFDGKEHLSVCPKCGVETSWRSPTMGKKDAR